MTTVVADREGMAADSQMTDIAVKTSVKKFWRIRGWLIGGAGTYPEILAIISEIKDLHQESPKKILEEHDIKVRDVDLLLLSPDGKLYLSENGSHPMHVQEGFAAIGTGSQGAMVAMYLGATPAEAVRVVKKVDPSTGGRVVVRKL